MNLTVLLFSGMRHDYPHSADKESQTQQGYMDARKKEKEKQKQKHKNKKP